MLKNPGFIPIESVYDKPIGFEEMSAEFSFEKICTQIASMSKSEVIKRLTHFEGPMKLDFTSEYLETLTTEKLRHILLAAVTTVKRKQAS
jgi:hypothetical protein